MSYEVTSAQKACDLIISEIKNRKLMDGNARVIVSIDGRAASGKTTLAELIHKNTECDVIHMDDFFLRPEQRTIERYLEPGGNVDRERFLEEVLLPLSNGDDVLLRRFDCHDMALKSPVLIHPKKLVIIEGTYSCHPKLWEYSDLHVFLDVPADEQLKRIAQRPGSNLEMFKEKWIPLEEKYFSFFDIPTKCHMKLQLI